MSDRPDNPRAPASACLAALALCAASGSLAQQNVPFANGIPVAPEMPIAAMPDHPVEYPTAEDMRIRVFVVTRGIEHPWSIAFVSNDVWLVTQTHGGLRVVRNGVLDPNPIAGLPEVRAQGLAYVELTTDPDNLASQRVIQANGGRLVERFRKAEAYGGAESLRWRIDL